MTNMYSSTAAVTRLLEIQNLLVTKLTVAISIKSNMINFFVTFFCSFVRRAVDVSGSLADRKFQSTNFSFSAQHLCSNLTVQRNAFYSTSSSWVNKKCFRTACGQYGLNPFWFLIFLTQIRIAIEMQIKASKCGVFFLFLVIKYLLQLYSTAGGRIRVLD